MELHYRVRYNLACLYSRMAIAVDERAGGESTDHERLLDRSAHHLEECLASIPGVLANTWRSGRSATRDLSGLRDRNRRRFESIVGPAVSGRRAREPPMSHERWNSTKGRSTVSTLIKVVVGAVFLAALIVVWVPVVGGDPTQQEAEWFGHVTAVAALALFTSLLLVVALDLKGLVVGRDNRVSTSKLQALIWTYAIAAALLSLIIAKWGGADKGYDALLSEELKDEYLLLLGGPFAAAVAAKAIVTTKVEQGTLTKTDGTPEPSQAFGDDMGNADLVDTQYLLFNLVALAFFVVTFVMQAEDGLPDIPDVLVALTGVAAATYVGNKAVLREAPTLLRIVPPSGMSGTTVTVYGKSLRLQRMVAGNPVFDPAKVTFDELEASVTDSQSTVTGEDRLTVTVPTKDVQAPTAVTVQAFNARGVASNTLSFTITP